MAFVYGTSHIAFAYGTSHMDLHNMVLRIWHLHMGLRI